MANVIYENTVLGNKYNSVLATKLNLNPYLTIDNSLTQEAGMKKKVISRTVTGDVEDLAQGHGNSGEISVGTTSKDYEVGTTQGRFVYFDEEAMADPMVVDTGLTGLSEKMINSFVSKATAEWEKASLRQKYTALGFDTVVDAIAKLNVEAEEGLFMLIAPDMVAAFRKALKDDLKYSEGFVRTGYIGHICGVPVMVSKAVTAKHAILASKDAVTVFLKKESEIEQERDANLRKNTVYARKVAVVAITDETKVVVIEPNA